MTEKQKRFEELSRRAYERGYTVYSEFLGLSELSELHTMRLSSPVSLWGGFDGAERTVACFGDREYYEDNGDYPIKCICIEPVSKKFADELRHRDFLGALMGLGIRREMLGDIIISENRGYLFCLETVCGYITENLKEVCRTTVRCKEIEKIPDCDLPEPQSEEFIVSSERLDVIVSAVYSMSRSKSQELFDKDRVFVNGALKSQSFTPSEGDKISVRGMGRFVYGSVLRRTKKDRLVINVKKYI